MRDNFPQIISTTVANGATESGAVDLGPQACAVAIELPSTLTGTSLKLKAADSEGGTYKSVRNTDGTEWSATVAADYVVPLPEGVKALQFIKLVVDAQAAERTLKVHRKALA